MLRLGRWRQTAEEIQARHAARIAAGLTPESQEEEEQRPEEKEGEELPEPMEVPDPKEDVAE